MPRIAFRRVISFRADAYDACASFSDGATAMTCSDVPSTFSLPNSCRTGTAARAMPAPHSSIVTAATANTRPIGSLSRIVRPEFMPGSFHNNMGIDIFTF